MSYINLNPSVSVIVPVYNGEKTIERCIQSILKQTYKNISIIVVDDGSTDQTEKILKKFVDNDKVTILHEKNSGASHARNVAIQKVKTDLISFVDSDDYVEVDFVKNMVEGLRVSNADMCITGINYIYGDKVKQSKYKKGIINKNNKNFWNTVLKANGPMGFIWNKLWKTSIIRSNRIKFDENVIISEDLLFCVEYLFSIDSINIISNYDYNYYVKPNMSFQVSELYLKTLQKIKLIFASKDKDLNDDVDVQISMGYINLIRKSYLEQKEINKITEFRMQAKKYGKKLIYSNYVSYKQKIAYVLTLYFPSCVKIIDRFKN